MIHIKYKIQKSPLHGVWLFADQDIVQWDCIYTPNPLLDVNISDAEFQKLDPKEQYEVQYYWYWNITTQQRHVAFDVIRFLNHWSDSQANVTQDDSMTMIAKRNIAPWEELLQDYVELYPLDGFHFRRIHYSKPSK